MYITKYFQSLIRDFTAILSGTVIVMSIFMPVLSIKEVDASLFWQVILLTLAATLMDMFFYYASLLGKMNFHLKVPVHFLLNTALYALGGYLFHWYEAGDYRFIIFFIASITVGYIAVFAIIYSNESRQAKLMNKKLAQYKQERGQNDE